MKSLRIATLQLNPKLGCINDNINRANLILSKALNAKKLDLLILPELGLSGYNFKSINHIKPFLESPTQFGPTLTWAKETSLKYNCFTVLGYPEILNSKIYNSAIVFNSNGEVIHNYQKSFLYETDEVWGCNEGQGFQSFTIMNGIKASIGICMDLNPYKFEAPFQKFEFSKFCYENDLNLIICPNAWLHSESPSITKQDDSLKYKELIDSNKNFIIDDKHEEIIDYELIKEFKDLNKPDYSTLNYWILRFFPFVDQFWKRNKLNHKTTVIINNRSGIEDDVLYCGSSSIFQFYGSNKPDKCDFKSIYFENNNVKVLGALGKGNEGILIRDIEI